jgi:hypothetical protein
MIKFEFEKVYGNILQIRETGFTSRDPMIEIIASKRAGNFEILNKGEP